MQYKFLALFLLFLSVSSFAQSSRGIHFEASDWEAVLVKAKQEGKIIFLDAYTTWCTPCKEMDRNVFTSTRLGNFYNKNFVSVKMDMEKGFGPALAIRYGVTIFPSIFYITGDGTLVHRLSGFQNIDRLVSGGHVALDPKKQMRAWEARYKDGDRHEDFMANYFMAKYNRQDGSHIGLVDEYFVAQKDWTTDRNVRLLFEFVKDASDPKFNFIVDHRARFDEILGVDRVTEKIEAYAEQRLYKDIPQPSIEEAEALMLKVYPDKGPLLFSGYRIKRHFEKEEYPQYAIAMVHHMDAYPTNDPKVLNFNAWKFYEHIQDKDHLNKALGWAKKSSKIEPAYYNGDTVAALYYKMGNKRKAKKFAKKAIKMAKKSGQDATTTKTLLEKIKSM